MKAVIGGNQPIPPSAQGKTNLARRGTPSMANNGTAIISPYKRNNKNTSVINNQAANTYQYPQAQKNLGENNAQIPPSTGVSNSQQTRKRDKVLMNSGGLAMSTPNSVLNKGNPAYSGQRGGGSAKKTDGLLNDVANKQPGGMQRFPTDHTGSHYSAVNVVHTENTKEFKQLLSQLQNNNSSLGVENSGSMQNLKGKGINGGTENSNNQRPADEGTNNKIFNVIKSQTNMNVPPGNNNKGAAKPGGGKINYGRSEMNQQQMPNGHNNKGAASLNRPSNHQMGGQFQQQQMNGNNMATPQQSQQQQRNSSVPYQHRQPGGKTGYQPNFSNQQQRQQPVNQYGIQNNNQNMTQQSNTTASTQQTTNDKGASNRFGGNQSNAQKNVRRIENLPRTGNEYVFEKIAVNKFISQHKEQEPLGDFPCAQHMLDEYIQADADRGNLSLGPQSIVYDCIDPSPHYENTVNDMYIDEKFLIELPNPTQQSEGVNEPYQKRYYFNPNNLPYSLEQPHSYSARTIPAGEKVSAADKQAAQGNKGPRLNRYYDQTKPYYKIKPAQQGIDCTLQFESRFESGNLRRAVKISDTEYDLFLKNDYGTNGFTQWYFFKVKNTRKDKVYRFNIVNLMKPDSTYNYGQKPLVYSVKEAEVNNIGWYRDGYNVAYYANTRKKKQGGGAPQTSNNTNPTQIPQSNQNMGAQSSSSYGPHYYSLTFEVLFKHDNDEVFFAHCYPYTYTDQCEFVRKVCHMHNKNKVRKTVLCKSLAGNEVDMLIVTNFLSDPVDIAVRKSVILTSRVHPGESNASFMMNGVIDFLVSDDPSADLLRNTFVFKIIPMLNPDGVIVGNYRCSLIGQDLNRQWIGSSSKFYPINYHTKLMMKRTLESRDIFFFCDMHGHSTGRNVFMFGNAQSKVSDKNKEKIFPMLFSENDDMFGFDECCFAVQKSKEACARQVMWKDFSLINSFTLEASFLGPNKGLNKGLHFSTTMLERMGRVFCKTLVDYVDNQEKVARIMNDLKIRFPPGGIGGPAPPRQTVPLSGPNAPKTDNQQNAQGAAQSNNNGTNNNNITTNNSHQNSASTGSKADPSGAPTNTTGEADK